MFIVTSHHFISFHYAYKILPEVVEFFGGLRWRGRITYYKCHDVKDSIVKFLLLPALPRTWIAMHCCLTAAISLHHIRNNTTTYNSAKLLFLACQHQWLIQKTERISLTQSWNYSNKLHSLGYFLWTRVLCFMSMEWYHMIHLIYRSFYFAN